MINSRETFSPLNLALWGNNTRVLPYRNQALEAILGFCLIEAKHYEHLVGEPKLFIEDHQIIIGDSQLFIET